MVLELRNPRISTEEILEAIMNKLKWICSTGGPLAIMGKEESEQWGGESFLEDRIHEPSFPITKDNHYKKACNVKGPWGIIELENHVAIIVSDEPVQTTWIPFDNELGGTIVRWIYAENSGEIEKHLKRMPVLNWNNDGIVKITSEFMYMFDSVGTIKETTEENRIMISLKIGTYEMHSQEYKPDENTHLRLQQFRRINQ